MRPPADWLAWEQAELAKFRRGWWRFSIWREVASALVQRGKWAGAQSPSRQRSVFLWLASAHAVGWLAAISIPRAAGATVQLLGLGLWVGWACFFSFMLWAIASLACLVAGEGKPQPMQSIGLPNGLSALRVVLAPLVVWPVLEVGPFTPWPALLAVVLAAFSATDLLDGWWARRTGLISPLGARLDPLGDVVLSTCLVVGLWRTQVVPWWFAAVGLLRYPGALVGAVVTLAVYGPVAIRGTRAGKLLTFGVSTLLVVLAAWRLLRPGIALPQLARGALALAALLMLANFLYLAAVAITEGRQIGFSESK